MERPSPPFLVFVMVALLIACSNTNNYFAYHAPGAIGASIRAYYDFDTTDLGLLFTMYSLPAVGMALISGLAIDRYGVNRMSIIFNLLILLGAVIIALTPPSRHALSSLLLGRMLIGFGESLCGSAGVMIERWYNGRALTFVTGFNMAFVQLFGSAAAFYVLPMLPSVPVAQWLTVAVCATSTLTNLGYVATSLRWTPPNEPATPDKSHAVEERQGPVGELFAFLRGESKMPLMFWLICTQAVCLCPILYTYTAFGPSLLMEKWGFTQEEAGSATSILYVTSLLSPVAGMLIDLIGYRIIWQAVFSTAIPLLMALMHFTPISPWLGMGLLGCAFAVTEPNTMAMATVVVPQKQLGFAYGIYSSSISIALIFEPTLVGHLKAVTGSYDASDYLFIVLGVLGWLMSLVIWYLNSSRDRLLCSPSTYLGQEKEDALLPTSGNSYGSTAETGA